MKALIVYGSWLGHNRAIARTLAAELTNRGMTVDCLPDSRVAAADVEEYDLLVLGTYTHGDKASPRLHELCETIPLHQFERMAVALFGTQMEVTQQNEKPAGIDELRTCLAERNCELAAEPLRFALPGASAFLPLPWMGATEEQRIADFAAELWEAAVPAPMV